MLTVYRCINTCTWQGRYWEEGAITAPFPSDIIPPQHFEKVSEVETLQEVLDSLDQEDEPDTFAALQETIDEARITGVGMMASDSLELKSREQLIEIAKEKGIDKPTMLNRMTLIKKIAELNNE